MNSPKIPLASILLISSVMMVPALGAQGAVCPGSWQDVTTVGPSARIRPAMAYDNAHGGTALFGGFESSGIYRGDTWIWNGTSWTQVATSGPSPRLGHAMVFDSSRGKVVLFGGLSLGTYRNDTWEWDGTSWREVVPFGPKPEPRSDAAMAYDSDRGKIVLFGGLKNSGGIYDTLADTWEWNGTSWTQVSTKGPPSREQAGMAYDAGRHVTVLFGGHQNIGGVDKGRLGDTWEWNGSEWTQKLATGPIARSSATLVYNAGCGSVFLFGGEGAPLGVAQSDSWSWNGKAWKQLATGGPARRGHHTMAYDSDRQRVVLFGGHTGLFIANDTWEWVSPCDDEGAVLDQSGEVIFPSNLDPSEPITYEDVDQNLGNVEDLDPSASPGFDSWYAELSCRPSIGGTVPPEASSPDLMKELTLLGITGATPQEIAEGLEDLQEVISNKAAQETDSLKVAGPVVTGSYNPPPAPHCKETGCNYVFGGRDIIFVHGLRMDPLFDKMFGTNPGALTTWPNDKAAFYGNGYWKQGAERYWADHIKKFFTDRGIQNRYLIVAYPSTQRLEVGAQAILTQIADAMMTGEGVVDPTGRNDKSGFGTPSFVIVSHSTGGLITDVAMAAAVRHANLEAEFIAHHAKAHIALNAVFSGSRLATAAIALSGYLTFVDPPPSWLCPLANICVRALNEFGSNNPTLSCPPNLLVLADSILVDLVPLVTQLKWGSYVKSTPVRTLTLAGAHPSYLAPIKYLLTLGYDDGVSNVESQTGNPNTVLFWPSGFNPAGPLALARVFDMGVFRTYPLRAIGYYRDQVGDHFLNPFSYVPHPALVAAGPTPHVSPTGMLQPVDSEYELTGGFNPLRRAPNHFSFIFSAADHFAGSTGPFNGLYYRDTFGEHNWEETRVITDAAVYQSYPMVYPGDDTPLITQGQVPPVEEILKGRRVSFTIKIFGRKIQKTWWIWKRRYHLLADWQNKNQMDYVYGSVLTQGLEPCPPPITANDCNHNVIADVCDISNGSSRDCNANRLPDDCEVIVPPTIFLQPESQTVNAGQTIQFTVGVTGTGPFSYQWRRNGVSLGNGGPISGATTNILKITAVTAAEAGVYDVLVTSGCGQVASARVTLRVDPPLPPPCILSGMPQGDIAPSHYRTVLSQTFRPDRNGTLTKIVHGLRDYGTHSIKSYNLYVTTVGTNGLPNWPQGVLYTAQGLNTFASSTGVDGAVAVMNGPFLSSANTYALVLEPIGTGFLSWRGSLSSGAYPKGAAFTRKIGSTLWKRALIPKDFGFKLEGTCCKTTACLLDPGQSQAGIHFDRRATLAQTFRPAQNGTLGWIVHSLRKAPSSVAKYNLFITTTNAAGQPSWPGGIVYSATDLSVFSSGGVTATVTITRTLNLSATTTYALILEPVGTGLMYWAGSSSAGSYPNGAAYEWNTAKRQWDLATTGPRDHGFQLGGSCCK